MKPHRSKAVLFVSIILFSLTSIAPADWSVDDGHKMHDAQLPDRNGWDVCLIDQTIADDFVCAESGPITGIHFWVSWRNDLEEFNRVSWSVSLCSDAKGRPGEVLWRWKEGDGELLWQLAGEGDQGWYCPAREQMIEGDHKNYYQVNIAGISDAFEQQRGQRYWLCIAASSEGKGEIGWKTSVTEYFSRAAWTVPLVGWMVTEGPFRDMAFVITGQSLDFGDAPDGAAAPGYPTLLANIGASHVITGPWLGDAKDAPDSESDGQPDATASGDDGDGNDDENGVQITSIAINGQTNITFEVNGGGGYVQAWVDFDGDSKWEPVRERIINDYYKDGIHTIQTGCPIDTALGHTFARFRISSEGGLGPAGPAQSGEVEDYPVLIYQKGEQDYLEPNNRLLEAIDLGRSVQKRMGLGIHEPGEEDWCKWTANNDGPITVNINFSRDLGKLKGELYDEEGNKLAESDTSELGEVLTYTVKAGHTYYTRVYGVSLVAATAYDFLLDQLSSTENYAVLFSGGIRLAKNFTRYYDNTKELYEILTNQYGLKPENIYVLYADGTDPADDLTTSTGTVNSDMSYALNVMEATQANLESVLTDILPADMNLGDHFLFWSFDHGGGSYGATGTTGEEVVCGWHENVSDEDLADWLDQVPALHKTIVLTQCFAGGMLDDIMPLTSTQFGCAATNHYEYSWGDQFAGAFNDGLRNHDHTYDVYLYAYNHDGCATDGQGPAGDVGDSIEHPWAATTTNFPIFHQPDNDAPWFLKLRPLRYVWPWEEVVIPFDLMQAAADMWDLDDAGLSFRIESVDSGLLRKGGEPVIPGETVLGFGESLELSPPQVMLQGAAVQQEPLVVDAFTIRVFDGDTISDQRLVVPIEFAEEGELPLAVDDQLVTEEDAIDVPVDVLANDIGVAPLSIVGLGQPLHGEVSMGKAVVLYSPSPEFSGSDSFTYFMQDASGKPHWAVVSVVVNRVNDPPQAYYDEFNVAPNSQDNLIDVLDNDFDQESKPMSFDPEATPYTISASVVDWPAHGTLTKMANEMFLYTPQSGYIGEDRFTYVVNDGQDDSNVAAAVIHIRHRRALKWVEQLPDETQNGIDIRVDNGDSLFRTIADDFECTSTGPLTDIMLWGSWKDDKKGEIARIRLSIHSDDPVGRMGSDPENTYSKPDQLLWSKVISRESFSEQLHARVRPGEYWYDYAQKLLLEAGDTEIWRVHATLDPKDTFWQLGTRDKPVVYWLEVSAETDSGEFGWKTRRWPRHYNDDAVIAIRSEEPRYWQELTYPAGHPYYAIEFEDLPLGTIYTVGDLFSTSSVQFGVKPYQLSDGSWYGSGRATVRDAGWAGGSGNELTISNVNVELHLPRVITQLSLLYGEYGGNCNLEINGDFSNLTNLADADGIVLSGVSVSVTPLGAGKGRLELSGPVSQLAIGGQEFAIDHIMGLGSVDMAFAVFTNPCFRPLADLDDNGEMDMADVMLFTDQWLRSAPVQDYLESDFDCNGRVGFSDFALLGLQWLNNLSQ